MKLVSFLSVMALVASTSFAQAQNLSKSNEDLVTKILSGRESGSGVGGRLEPAQREHSGSGVGGRVVPNQRGHSGSGVGGGVIYDSIVAWCDDTTVILNESRLEAREILGFQNDKLGALRTYYSGMLTAMESSRDSGNVSVTNSVTLMFVARGIKLAQLLGATQMINGNFETSVDLRVDSLVSFFDWYVGYTEEVASRLDKILYVPYVTKRDCRGSDCATIPSVSMIELEKKLFSASIGLVKELDRNFVRTKSDYNSFYTTLKPVDYFKALAFLTAEVSKDLNESLFSNAYACQAKRLQRLSSAINLYVQTRGTGEMDAIKLNKFSLELRHVVAALENKTCL